MLDSFTILVSSCDKYEDLWVPFFSLLKNKWRELPNYEIVLNTESKIFTMDGLNIKCFQLYKKNEKVAWGERLIETLKRINSDYILFLLDDFFIRSEVDDAKIKECLYLFEKDPHASVIYLTPTSGYREDTKIEDFYILKKDATWKLNTQAALWRRKKLIEYIRPHETAWAWEQYGSIRAQRYKENFYIRSPFLALIFDYEKDWGGAIHRGKWTPYAIELCNKYDFGIDYSIRGVETDIPPFLGEEENRIDDDKIERWLRKMKKRMVYLFDFIKEKLIMYKSLK